MRNSGIPVSFFLSRQDRTASTFNTPPLERITKDIREGFKSITIF